MRFRVDDGHAGCAEDIVEDFQVSIVAAHGGKCVLQGLHLGGCKDIRVVHDRMAWSLTKGRVDLSIFLVPADGVEVLSGGEITLKAPVLRVVATVIGDGWVLGERDVVGSVTEGVLSEAAQ